MTENLTISNQLPEYPGMNFALLRQEGIKHIENLAGKLWTDYNTHDPGITILEQLCYAITDLSYRLSFDIQDLLTPSVRENRKQFFTAREILSVNPLTINDYRKLLLDIDGVKNAWLEPIEDSLPEIYYDSNRHTLTFTSSEITRPVKLNGLYRVIIEKKDELSQENLIEQVKSKLHQHRNLCEDFAQIEILPIEEISIKADIEIEDGFDANDLMAKIYFGIDNFISPGVDFLTLKEILAKDKTPAEIFEGFPLEHGFIDDEQLQRLTRKKELHTSDLIHIILDITGIKTVKSIKISSTKSPELEEWTLELNINHTPKLKDVARGLTDKDITFYKGQIICNLNLEKIQDQLKSFQLENTKVPSIIDKKDIPIPIGEYRELSDYESIQNEFPANYGIGELGLPSSASPKRQAQAKQLQAYLMFFDQILANYFAQLEHFKDLFALNTEGYKTYFSQMLNNFPGAEDILNKYPDESIQDKKIDLERRNRFLDYLIAQYCEKFTDYSLLLYDSILEEELIKNKVDFLQDYPQISGGRGKAFNYIDKNPNWDTDNVSGLKRRISRLLGIPFTRQKLADSNIEGFHLLEHILLRPQSHNAAAQNPTFLTFSRTISQFSQSSQAPSTKVTCLSLQHNLTEVNQIEIFDTRYYNGIYFVTNIQEDTFDIETAFTKPDNGQWVRRDQHSDPYSFQISLVFPNWLPRFQNENFRQLIDNVLNAEIPAHVTIYYHWLNQDQMQIFETAYHQWLQIMSDETAYTAGIEATTNRLIELLQIGVTPIPPLVIGYMTIGTDFSVV
ncbi:MAG: hypothetical protein ACFKPT_02860 [Gloeotrichia echinulata GP01]